MKSFWRADSPEGETIPVAKPRLPTAAQIAPYLKRIDAARWYSNGGPLIQEFEARLTQHCGGNTTHVATVANATMGLALALLASDLPEGSLCMVPSWTFAATGHAILLAGLVPWIVDVNRETWTLEPGAALSLMAEAPGSVSSVIPVSPFGAPIEMRQWKKFRRETGLAVIVDAAAAFDCIESNEVPAVVSLHATKVCGVGEGGLVVASDESFIQEVRKRANFGFWNSRESTARSFNAKLSEYAAAVGLTSLDEWPDTRADFLRVAEAYCSLLAEGDHIRLQPAFGRDWVSSTVVIECENADVLADSLSKHRIGSRRWWGGGLHQHGSFEKFPRHSVRQTEALADHVIGLPCWRDLPNDDIARVCEVVLSNR